MSTAHLVMCRLVFLPRQASHPETQPFATSLPRSTHIDFAGRVGQCVSFTSERGHAFRAEETSMQAVEAVEPSDRSDSHFSRAWDPCSWVRGCQP